jgi:phosphoadenosine phosphosulfate reductase
MRGLEERDLDGQNLDGQYGDAQHVDAQHVDAPRLDASYTNGGGVAARDHVGLAPEADADHDRAAELSARFSAEPTEDLLRAAITRLFPGQIAVVSSFGADSAVLLHMVSRIDPATPIVFVDTGHLFAETLGYRDALVARLGLRDCTTVDPDAAELIAQDPEAFLWAGDQDSCCDLRKIRPLARALEGKAAWISGRKRFQASTRKELALFETSGGRVKINPLAAWSPRDLLDYMRAWDLPRHPLVARNFLSIGCMPCTSPVRPGEDPRAGRWRGKGKVECGIHMSFPEAGAGI